MTDDIPPADRESGRRQIDRRKILKGIGAGVGLGLTGALTTDTASALGIDQRIEINVKPGSDPNSINCGKKGSTPVAILTTDEFDATTVDPSSLRFGKPVVVAAGDGAELAHEGGHFEDAEPDKGRPDGDTDFVGHFETADTEFTANDSEAWLYGKTQDDRTILGTDSVKPVGNCPTEADVLPEVDLGSTDERSPGNAPTPPEPPEEKQTPPEGKRVDEQTFEDWKLRASNGELQHPPAETIQEDVGSDEQASTEAAVTTTEGIGATQQSDISIDRQFAGWENGDVFYNPPDSNIAVGPGKVLLAVNARWGIYDKDGDLEVEIRLSDWFEPVLAEDESFVFDPKLAYDHHNGRFVLMAVAKERFGPDKKSSWVVGVSAGDEPADPYGTWLITRIPHDDPETWVDYPSLGVDANGIYLTANIHEFGSDNFQFAKLVSIDKSALYAGDTFTYWWFNEVKRHDGTSAWTIQSTYDAPGSDSGDSQYFVTSKWNKSDAITLLELRNPASDPRLFSYKVSVDKFSLPPDSEQPDTEDKIGSSDARMMNAVFHDGSVWAVHTIGYNWDADDDNDASAIIKWYEIDPNGVSVVQSAGWGRTDGDYYFPTIAASDFGMMIVYNESGSEFVYPRIEVAGRTHDYDQNFIEEWTTLRYGASEYETTDEDGTARWGDYSGIAVDSVLGSFWAYSQFSDDEESSFSWGTYVGEVTF